MNKLFKYIKNILRLKCSHSGALTRNYKYCPDCGKKVAYKWVVIKCKACGHYRKPLVDWLGKIKPMKKYCFHCGSDGWDVHNYYEKTIPDSMKPIAVKQLDPRKQYRFGELTQKTKIWISLPGEKG